MEFFGFTIERAKPQLPPFKRETAPDYALLPHQLRAARRVKELLYDGPRRAVLHLPTGVGKTRTGMSMICDHLRQHGPTLVVWLAHGQELLEQAATEFERAWSKVGDRPLPTLRVWGSASPALTDVTDGLVVLGLEKAVSTAKSAPQSLRTLAARSTLTVFDVPVSLLENAFNAEVEARLHAIPELGQLTAEQRLTNVELQQAIAERTGDTEDQARRTTETLAAWLRHFGH